MKYLNFWLSQLSVVAPSPGKNDLERIDIFGNPELLHLMHSKLQAHSDGVFLSCSLLASKLQLPCLVAIKPWLTLQHSVL